ncbi:methyl-accepting chemotaxis protein [Pseudoduganella namucuonensis]|uniref:Methyl-accepting chemotaxis protein n=1 Tax=Pseudoduganella namucuonensis TaxID=1035707 RepID=A0A1I7M0W7_9BURK|nr:methyl-accepting chemotaxis protein [Pseudoduganella namucuonensis]SFV15612.1 methyl-accepting chemotaxis protein [Pseudoduganella namucuonensis]
MAWLNDFRIRTRLRFGFGVILALLVAVLVTDNVISIKNREHLFDGIAASNVKVELTARMKAAQLEGVVAIRSIGLHTEAAAMNQEQERLKQQRKLYVEARDQLMALGVSEAGKQIFANLARLDRELEAPTSDAIAQALGFNPEAVASLISTRIDPLYRAVLVEMNKLVALQKAEQNQLLANATASGQQLMYVLSVIGLLALVVGIVFSQLITNSIVGPLNAAVAVAKRVAAGDLNSAIQTGGRDEAGDLLQALDEMNRSLIHIVGKVRGGTSTIAQVSQQIATSNQHLSARTEQQASALEQTAASMEELTSTVRQNAGNAQQANRLALDASSVAVKGGDVVSQVVDTMGAINDSSKKIVDIIGVINGIAFQTNILALNAAVEAARAGEQGRGFAVVASEVRNLAQRSAAAAEEIKQLIGASVERVDAGAKLVNQAGATMNDIVDSVRRVTDIMADISNASQEQTAGLEQINQAIAQMDEVTQQNGKLVEEATSAVNSLRDQADGLLQVVRVFSIDQPGGPAPVIELAAARAGAERPAAPRPRIARTG